MQINFEKTDRLIELINDSSFAINDYHFEKAYNLKNSENEKLRTLYSELVALNQSGLKPEEKHIIQIQKFAEAYGFKDNLEKGEEFLKLTFDESAILKRLAKAYWQISPIRITCSSDNTAIDDLKQFIDTRYCNEPCKEVMIETILKREPSEEEIESEFWVNCSDVNNIDEFCNIYRERFNGNLKDVDKEYYNYNKILFDEENQLCVYFKELRACGLLSYNFRYVEARVIHIANAIDSMSNAIIKVFKRLRASSRQTVTKKCNEVQIAEFLHNFCRVIETLQQDEIKHQCSKNIIENIKHEAPFRDAFRASLTQNYHSCDVEPEKGSGRIDLKIDDSDKLPYRLIIEFKGWWNRDKNEVVEQCLGYLTDFERSAVVFMINHTQSPILKKYKENIVLRDKSYVQNSWRELKYKETDYKYYESEHIIDGHVKTLYHFIVSPKIYCKR